MFCKTCGKEMNDGVQFCPGCGAAMQAEAQPGQQQYAPPPAQPGYAPPPAYGQPVGDAALGVPQAGAQPGQQQYAPPPAYGQPVGDAALGVPQAGAQPAYQVPPAQPGYAQPPAQPGYAQPPAQPGYAPPPAQPGYAPLPPKKGLSNKMLLIIIIAAAAAAALILMGVFGVFGDSKTDKPGKSVEDDIDDMDDIDDADDPGDADDTDGTGDTDIYGLGDDDIKHGWPSSELPPGFPEYPNGDPSFVADYYGAVLVYIEETDKKTFDSYMDSLEPLGFEFFLTNAENVYQGAGDDWTATIEFIQIEDMADVFMQFNIGSSDPNLGPSRFVWPDEIPEYPDGAFEVSLEEERNSVVILISNTSRKSCEEYVDILVKAGWEFVGAYSESDWYFRKGERGVVLTLQSGEKYVSVIVQDD